MALKSALKSFLTFIFCFWEKQNPRKDIFAWLPQEVIMYHILPRLPVKTLLRLKSVSKSWLSLISSPSFIEIHLAKSTNDPHLTHTHLLVSFVPFAPNGEPENVPGLVKSFTSLSLYSLLNERVTEPIEHDYLGVKFMYLVGHCKGLVCAVVDEYVLLWNPSTRKFRRLPKLKYQFSKYGFGYDELTNDFKVVAISSCRHPFNECVVSIYSSKTSYWRMIGKFPIEGVLDGDGIFTSKAIHWIIRPSVGFNYPKFVIVSLDLTTETYREILPPECGEEVYWHTLGTLGKQLTFCEFDYGNAHAKLWILKKQECWTQLVTIPYMNMDNLRQMYLTPKQIFVKGDVILSSESNLRLHNSKDNTYRELLDGGMGWLRGVDTYVESLVSPLL